MVKIKEKQPLVTVYMPTYNRVELLQRAVESVLKQDYRNIELIVVDDRSTDGTPEYLAKMAKEDPRFKYFINEKNSGACVSRNKAIFAANGEFITGLDDDDYFLPNRISSFLRTWNSKSDSCIALYSHVYIQKSDTKFIKSKKIACCDHRDLIYSNWIGNQIFTQVEALKKINGFDINLPAWQDLECWFRLLKSSKLNACLSNEFTYIVDISHPHERITSKKGSSVTKAFEYFCDKHKLPINLKRALQLQLDPYINNCSNIRPVISAIFILPRVHILKKVARIYISSRVKKLLFLYVNK